MTYQDAQDEIFGIVQSKVPGGTYIAYPGVPAADKPGMTKLWVRASMSIVSDGQASLGNSGGVKMYEATGLLAIQLFAPRNIAGSKEDSLALAEQLRSEFRRSSPSELIWFRDQKIVEVPETEDSYPVNVFVTFTYQTQQ